MYFGTSTSWRRGLLLSALLFSSPVLAGPPLLCHPFETAEAPTLPWGGDGWNQARADYDLAALGERTEALLGPGTPVIARMETLRRAAIYASRDGAVLRDLAARLESRLKSADEPGARVLGLFDTGYFLETLQEIDRLQDYDMPGIGEVDRVVLRALLTQPDGSLRIQQAVAMQPDDAGLRFAAALVATADGRDADVAMHARHARAGAESDALLALNIGLIPR
jgi:hypothetical protein